MTQEKSNRGTAARAMRAKAAKVNPLKKQATKDRIDSNQLVEAAMLAKTPAAWRSKPAIAKAKAKAKTSTAKAKAAVKKGTPTSRGQMGRKKK